VLNNAGLGFVFTARDMASRSFKKINRNFSTLDNNTTAGAARIASNFSRVKMGIGMLAAGGLMVAAGIGLANKAGKFGQGIAAVGAVSRASAADLETLRDAALEASMKTQFSPDEAVEGLRNFAQQGLNAKDSMTALTPALDLAAAGMISVDESTAAVGAAAAVFGLSMDETGLAVDKMMRVTNISKLAAGDLAHAIGTVSRGAGLAGQSLDEMLISMGMVRDTGVDASVAASSVSSALTYMAKNSKKFKQLGVDVTDANGKFRDFGDIVLDTQGVLGKYTDDAERSAKATQLFGRFGSTAYTALSKQMTDGVKDLEGNVHYAADALAMLRGEIANAGGAAAEFREDILDTYEGQKGLIGGLASGLAVVMGEPFTQVLKPVLKGIVSVLTVIVRAIKDAPAPLKRFVAGLFMAVGAVLAVIGLGLLIKAAFGLVAAAVGSAIAALASFAAVAAPFIAIALVLAATAAIVYYAYKRNLGWFGDAVRETYAKVSLFFRGLIDLFKYGGFSEAVMEELDRAGNKGVLGFLIQLYRIGYRIKKFWTGLVDGFSEVAGPAFGELGEVFGEFFGALVELGREIAGIFSGLDEGADAMMPTGQKVMGFGEIIGKVFGFVIGRIVDVIRFFVKIGTVSAQVVRHVIGFFKEFGSELGDFIARYYNLFGELWRAAGGFFSKIGKAILWAVQPVIDIIQAMVDKIIWAYEKVSELISGSSAVETVSAKVKMQVDRQEAEAAVRGSVAIESLPAMAQAEAQGRVFAAASAPGASPAAIAREVMRAAAELSKRGDIVVQIDGAEVARAVESAQAGSSSRSFDPAPIPVM